MKISDEAIFKATGGDWAHWFNLLDSADATKMTHKEIARMLGEMDSVSFWWAQSITVAYEQARGMRQVHEHKDGYHIGVSKTIGAPLDELYNHCLEQELRESWMPGSAMKIRKDNPGKNIRFDYLDDDTIVVIHFIEKGPFKTQVTIQHTKLANSEVAGSMKPVWKERLSKLASLV